jgi:hypothetical protein
MKAWVSSRAAERVTQGADDLVERLGPGFGSASLIVGDGATGDAGETRRARSGYIRRRAAGWREW